MITRELVVLAIVLALLVRTRWRRKRREYECNYPATVYTEEEVRERWRRGREHYEQGLVHLRPGPEVDEQGLVRLGAEEVLEPYREWARSTGRRWSHRAEQEYMMMEQQRAQQELAQRMLEQAVYPAVWMADGMDAIDSCRMTTATLTPGIPRGPRYAIGPPPTRAKECPYCGTQQVYGEVEKCKECKGPWSRRKYT